MADGNNKPREVLSIEKTAPQSLAETNTAASIARAQQEVQGAIIIAKRFPRNEDECRAKLLRACKRPEFAEDAEYEFPRGNGNVNGPSVYLAREAARIWGNIHYGAEILRDDGDTRIIRCFAWDMETNTRPIQDDSFRKLVYRKQGGWVEPDERDLRELTNRRAAIGYRNCILEVIPSDLIREAVTVARKTLKDKAAADPDGERKRIVDAFAEINVMPTRLDQILGHPLAEASPDEIARLRGIYKSIRDGNSTLSDYIKSNGAEESQEAKEDPNADLKQKIYDLMRDLRVDSEGKPYTKARIIAAIESWPGPLETMKDAMLAERERRKNPSAAPVPDAPAPAEAKQDCPTCAKMKAICPACAKKDVEAKRERTRQFVELWQQAAKIQGKDVPEGVPTLEAFDKMDAPRQNEAVAQLREYVAMAEKQGAPPVSKESLF
jgi:hypothetical protein